MKVELNGSVVLITGAGSGIGGATARLMAQAGARLNLVGIPAQGVADLARELADRGAEAIATPCDVGDPQAVQTAVQRSVEAFGKLDVVVASAGIQLHTADRDLHAMDDEAWQRTHRVNYDGVYHTCKASLKQMVQQGQGGSIIVVASIAGLCGASANVAYTAGKHGLIGLSRYIAVHYAKHGIRCNAICPGALQTLPNHGEHPDPVARAAQRLSRIPLGRLGRSEEIAPWIVLLASPMGGYATGGVFAVDGGFTAG